MFNNVATGIKFFSFIYSILEGTYFARKHDLGKYSLYYYISSKVAGYLERSNETPTSI